MNYTQNLLENSSLEYNHITDVEKLAELILEYEPNEIYLTGSSIDTEDYGDIDLGVNFDIENYSFGLETELLEYLDESNRFGSDKNDRGRKKAVIRGKIRGQSYDVFLWEDRILPNNLSLQIHP